MYVTCACVIIIIVLAGFTNIKCKMGELLQTAKNGYKRQFLPDYCYFMPLLPCTCTQATKWATLMWQDNNKQQPITVT
jgi:hypothetical protein